MLLDQKYLPMKSVSFGGEEDIATWDREESDRDSDDDVVDDRVPQDQIPSNLDAKYVEGSVGMVRGGKSRI